MNLNIPSEILHKFFNLGGLEKKLYCKRCSAYTNHVSVSYSAGITDSESHSLIQKAIFRLLDFSPGGPLITGNLFACTVCETIRLDGGITSDVINQME